MFRILCNALILAGTFIISPSVWAEPRWTVSDDGHEVKMGLIDPSYSPNEFFTLALTCDKRTMRYFAVAEVSSRPIPGPVNVIISNRTRRVTLSGYPEGDPDSYWIVVSLTSSHPIFDLLASGPLYFRSPEGEALLPTRGLAQALPNFRRRCNGTSSIYD
jgi:hypothetical protein